jgi:hypothetical protein
MTNKIVVIDASIAIQAILPNPLQGYCRALAQTFADIQPVAPDLEQNRIAFDWTPRRRRGLAYESASGFSFSLTAFQKFLRALVSKICICISYQARTAFCLPQSQWKS